MLISIFFLVGCSDEISIQTDYDSIKLEITNTMNAGCAGDIEETYFTHNIQDKHTYIFDYKKNLEYIKTDHWVGYNTISEQYVSSDLGVTFFNSKDLSTKIFESDYRNDLNKLFTYIADGKAINLDSDGNYKIFSVDFEDDNFKVFEIIKKFGTVNSSDELKSITTTVTVKGDDITKILFEVSSVSHDGMLNNCYNIEWTFSDFNSISVNLPTEIQ